MSAAFTRIDRRGHPLEVLAQLHTRIGSIKGYESVPVSLEIRKPGFYRADISVHSSSGRELARYGAYTRLLPLIARPPRLVLNATSFIPGERVMARVENFSTASISYGAQYSIERRDGAAWMKAPESPRIFILPLYGTSPGGTGPCLPFGIPKTMTPGEYRMAKPISASNGPRRLFAKFEVR